MGPSVMQAALIGLGVCGSLPLFDLVIFSFANKVHSFIHSFFLSFIHTEHECKKNCSLSTSYNGENDTSKTAKIMNGGVTLAALCHCQRASKVISPVIIFAVFDEIGRASCRERV